MDILRQRVPFFFHHCSAYYDIVSGVSPLSLPKAKANSLQYVKAFGGTEQRNLPDNYIQRQYIYMTESSYLLTDIVPTPDCKIEFDFQTLIITSSARTYLGCRDTSGSNNGLRVAHVSNGNFRIYGFGTYTDSVATAQNNTRYKFVWDNKRAIVTSGGTTIFDNTFDAGGTNQTAIAINGWNTAGTVDANSEGMYLYSFKAWDNQGNLIANYVPAVQRGTVPVVGFYDTVSKTFKTATAGTFAAGAEAVPTPDTPMDIVSNNGVLKVHQNLWKGNYTDLGYLDETGAVIPTTGYMASDFIEIDQSKKYTFYEQIISAYTGNGMRICFYNSSKQKVGVRQGGEAKEINSYAYVAIPPAGAKYIRVSTGVSANNVTSITLVEGEYNTTTIQGVVGSIYTDGTVETVWVHGKNLFDENNVTLGYFYEDNGTYTSNANTFTSGKIPMNAGTTVTFSRGLSVNNVYLRIHAFNSNNEWVGLVAKSASSSSLSVTGTTPANTSYIRVCGAKRAGGDEIDHECQVEQGSTATAYVPYFNGGTATAEMLLKVGTYQDVQSIIDGAVTRNVGIKVLDGTESWQLNSNRFRASGLVPVSESNVMLCSHFAYTGNLTTDNTIYRAPESAWLQVRYDTANNDVTTFTNFLKAQYSASTPVIIIYPLATATTDSVTGQTLQVQAGENILEITQASLNGLELEAKYRRTK